MNIYWGRFSLVQDRDIGNPVNSKLTGKIRAENFHFP